MTVTIYVEQQTAILKANGYTVSLTSYENGNILCSYREENAAWTEKYENLEELLLDQRLNEAVKWVARGFSGMPKKKDC